MSSTSDAAPGPADDGGDLDVPFGLPVLAEVPELAAVLELAVEVDRLLARIIDLIVVADLPALSAAATGVPLEQWLGIVARRTRTDRRMLQTAAEVCRRLPSVRAAFGEGAVSWSQVRTLTLRVHRLPRHLDDRIDAALARAIDGAAGADPDALARVVGWVLTDLETTDDAEEGERPGPDDILVLQPRLDGSGGTFWGDLGPVGFAALDTVTDPGPTGTTTRTAFGADPDPGSEVAATNRRSAGHARAANLIDLCLRGGPTDQPGEPTLYLRAELDTLLGRNRLPGQLLTTLAGGRMHVDARTASRLVDRYGTDLRLVLLDHGNVVGVGTKRRHPPGWLTDAVLAVHDTCTEPGCQSAARICDLDHATPAADGGPTDIANLAPLCRPANVRKETDGWRATQTADGIRTWTHPRTGLTTTTIPATRRPPPDDPQARGDPATGPDP